MVLLFTAVGYCLWIHTFPRQYTYKSCTVHLNTLRFQQTIIYLIHLKWIFYNNHKKFTPFSIISTRSVLPYHLPSINKSLLTPNFEAFSMKQARHFTVQFIHTSIYNFISSSNEPKLRRIQNLTPHQLHTTANHFTYRKMDTS